MAAEARQETASEAPAQMGQVLGTLSLPVGGWCPDIFRAIRTWRRDRNLSGRAQRAEPEPVCAKFEETDVACDARTISSWLLLFRSGATSHVRVWSLRFCDR